MRALAALTLLAALPTCGSSAHLRYAPHLVDQALVAPGEDGPVARALLSVAETRDEGRLRELHLHLRLENLTEEPVVLDPDELSLLTADLASLGTARLDEPPPHDVPPRETRTFELVFPLPVELDKGGDVPATLHLRGSVRWGEHQLPLGADLRREAPKDDGRWPATFFSVGLGVRL